MLLRSKYTSNYAYDTMKLNSCNPYDPFINTEKFTTKQTVTTVYFRMFVLVEQKKKLILTVEKLPSPTVFPKIKSFGVLLAGTVACGGTELRTTSGPAGILAAGDCTLAGGCAPLHCFLLSGGMATTFTGKAGTLCGQKIQKHVE